MNRYAYSLLRHVFGYLVLLPAILLAIGIQALIGKPVFGNQTVIPHLIYKACGLLFGVRFEINPEGVPITDSGNTMFVLNHLARFDFVALHLFPRAAVMMNARIHQMPIWGPIVKVFTSSSGFIATEQNSEGKGRDHTQLGAAVQDGQNIVVFPEGIQTDGLRVLRYSAGSTEIFYDADLIAQYPALKTAQVQPVILRVKSIDGQDVLDQPEKWSRYALTHKLVNIFVGMSRLTAAKSIVVDMLVCPALNPADFKTAADLMNAAHEVTRAIIAPGQTTALTRKQWKERIDARDFSL